MPTIQINAFDPLFFRDARPFEMGDENTGNIQFPPNPTVLRGMIRSIGVFHNNEFDNADKSSENIEITNIEILNNNNPIFPIPLDLLAYKGTNQTCGLELYKKSLSSSPMHQELRPNKLEKTQDFDSCYLTQGSFLRYMMQGKDDFTIQGNIIDIKTIAISEPKFGIGRNKQTHTVQDGKLFKIPMIRLSNEKQENLKLKIEFKTDIDFPENGFERFGGESKFIHFNSKETQTIEKPNFINHRFKIYLASPAIFKNGALPNIEILSQKAGITLNLIACAVGKPIHIGGFDMVKKQPKPMYKAVPAGSVYYFEIGDKNDMPKVIDALHGQSITEELRKDGFGKIYICNLKGN